MLVPVLLFVVGLVFLIKGGDWFVDGATDIAHRFRMPELLIGATIVSIGTTLPEVMVSATAAVSGHSQIAYGNAIGSIICNTALILAITAVATPQKVERKGLVTPVAFFFAAATFYAGIAYVQGYFSRVTGMVLLATFVIYMVVLIKKASGAPRKETVFLSVKPNVTANIAANANRSIGNSSENSSMNSGARAAVKSMNLEKSNEGEDKKSFAMEIVLLVVGAALIAVGADLLVDNGTIIATSLGVPESVIALTFVALGTSLPELVTAITSLLKGHGALSLGNVIGANLFNLVLVSGMACTLTPFAIPANKMIAGINSSLLIDIPLMLIVMLIATVPTIAKGRISRWQGILLLTIYVLFCASQFIM